MSAEMTGADPGATTDERTFGILGAAVAVTVWGATGVIAKDIDMGGLALGGYRFLLYGIVVSALMFARRTPITIRALRHSFWGGICLGADVALFFTAVKLTTIANATIVGALQTVVVSLVAAKFFGERITLRDASYAFLALIGVVIVAVGSAGSESWSLGGDLAAVGALFAWSAYFIAARHAQANVSTNEYTVCVALYVGLINVPLAAAFGQDLSWPSARSWFWLSVMAFGAGILGHTLMNWSLRRVPLWLVSTFTLFIPVVSSFLAWVVLDEALKPSQMGAMVLVVIALAAIVRNQTRPRVGGIPAAETGQSQ